MERRISKHFKSHYSCIFPFIPMICCGSIWRHAPYEFVDVYRRPCQNWLKSSVNQAVGSTHSWNPLLTLTWIPIPTRRILWVEEQLRADVTSPKMLEDQVHFDWSTCNIPVHSTKTQRSKDSVRFAAVQLLHLYLGPKPQAMSRG